MKSSLHRLDSLSRRQFAESIAKTALGVSVLPSLGQCQDTGNGTAKNVIYLFMAGGMSHLETLDPKENSDSPTESIETTIPGVRLSSYMPQLARNLGDVALIRSLTQRTGDHRGATHWMRTSYRPRTEVLHPGVAAWAHRLLGPSHPRLPSSVIIGGYTTHPAAGFFGPEYSPIPLIDPEKGLPNGRPPEQIDVETYRNRVALAGVLGEEFDQTFQNDDIRAYHEFFDHTLELMQSSDLETFNLRRVGIGARQRYGMNTFGQGVLLAKRLVQSGVRFVEVEKTNWDHHNNLWDTLPEMVSDVDVALCALIEDLKAEGLFDSTLIVLTTEFGRTPVVNGAAGRDHHPLCFSALVAGGGVNGGQVWGRTDARGYAVEESPVTPADLNATIGWTLGMPADRMQKSPSGRPYLFAGHQRNATTQELEAEGQPIRGLFGI